MNGKESAPGSSECEHKVHPTPFQRAACWSALTGIALIIIILIICGMIYGFSYFFIAFEPALLPIIIAAVLACILYRPVVMVQRRFLEDVFLTLPIKRYMKMSRWKKNKWIFKRTVGQLGSLIMQGLSGLFSKSKGLFRKSKKGKRNKQEQRRRKKKKYLLDLMKEKVERLQAEAKTNKSRARELNALKKELIRIQKKIRMGAVAIVLSVVTVLFCALCYSIARPTYQQARTLIEQREQNIRKIVNIFNSLTADSAFIQSVINVAYESVCKDVDKDATLSEETKKRIHNALSYEKANGIDIEQHSRLSDNEKKYIMSALATQSQMNLSHHVDQDPTLSDEEKNRIKAALSGEDQFEINLEEYSKLFDHEKEYIKNKLTHQEDVAAYPKLTTAEESYLRATLMFLRDSNVVDNSAELTEKEKNFIKSVLTYSMYTGSPEQLEPLVYNKEKRYITSRFEIETERIENTKHGSEKSTPQSATDRCILKVQEDSAIFSQERRHILSALICHKIYSGVDQATDLSAEEKKRIKAALMYPNGLALTSEEKEHIHNVLTPNTEEDPDKARKEYIRDYLLFPGDLPESEEKRQDALEYLTSNQELTNREKDYIRSVLLYPEDSKQSARSLSALKYRIICNNVANDTNLFKKKKERIIAALTYHILCTDVDQYSNFSVDERQSLKTAALHQIYQIHKKKAVAIFDHYSDLAAHSVWNWATAGTRAIFGAVGYIVGIVMIPIFLFYFLYKAEELSETWHDLLPLTNSRFRTEVVATITEIKDYISSFIRGQMFTSLIDGILLCVLLSAARLPGSIIIASVAAILGIIPYVGMISTGLPACLIALLNPQFGLHPVVYALIILLIFITVSQFDGWFLQPKIVGNSVGMSDLSVMFAILFWGSALGGIVGALLAVPITSALKVLFIRYVWSSFHTTDAAPPEEHLPPPTTKP